MNTDGRRYRLVYPDGTATDLLTWDERREAQERAPSGTLWIDAEGVVLATVRGTMAEVWTAIVKLDARGRSEAA